MCSLETRIILLHAYIMQPCTYSGSRIDSHVVNGVVIEIPGLPLGMWCAFWWPCRWDIQAPAY